MRELFRGKCQDSFSFSEHPAVEWVGTGTDIIINYLSRSREALMRFSNYTVARRVLPALCGKASV